jgi:nicotinamidase-related amidase
VHREHVAERIEQLLDVEPSRVAVLLVDFQRDFCGDVASGGHASGTMGNLQAALRANEFASDASRLGVRVIYSQQLLDLDRLTPRQRRWERDSQLCVAGSPGAELFMEPVPGARVVVKHRLDVWQSREFRDVLEEWDIDGLVIGGCELQACVLYAVLGANERGYHYAVVQDLVSGMDACERTCNRSVRDYLGYVHPSFESGQQLLAGWRERHEGGRQPAVDR